VIRIDYEETSSTYKKRLTVVAEKEIPSARKTWQVDSMELIRVRVDAIQPARFTHKGSGKPY
jgi:hypothetical protein